MVIRARLVSAPRRSDAATFVLVGVRDRVVVLFTHRFILKRIGDSFKYNTGFYQLGCLSV